MQLYFVRHAQSENNKMWSETGSSQGRSEDPGITTLGRKQARYLAKFIHTQHPVNPSSPYDDVNPHGIRLTHLYTSLMARAVLTGHAVAEKLDLPLVGLVDVHEGGGIYLDDEETGEPRGLPGKTPAELLHLSPRLVLPEINPAGWWNRSFEEREERIGRAKRALAVILEKHGGTDDRVAIFSHAAFYNYFLTAIFELDERLPLWFFLNNTGITRIDFDEQGAMLVYSNRIEHLPAAMLT